MPENEYKSYKLSSGQRISVHREDTILYLNGHIYISGDSVKELRDILNKHFPDEKTDFVSLP
jgi:hypothetical protein